MCHFSWPSSPYALPSASQIEAKNYRCSLRKGKMLTAPPWAFLASFLYELQFISLCVFPYQACSLSRVPKLDFSQHLQVHHVNDTPLSFLPLEFRTCAHPREMQPETYTQRHFPRLPTSLCLPSVMYSEYTCQFYLAAANTHE